MLKHAFAAVTWDDKRRRCTSSLPSNLGAVSWEEGGWGPARRPRLIMPFARPPRGAKSRGDRGTQTHSLELSGNPHMSTSQSTTTSQTHPPPPSPYCLDNVTSMETSAVSSTASFRKDVFASCSPFLPPPTLYRPDSTQVGLPYMVAAGQGASAGQGHMPHAICRSHSSTSEATRGRRLTSARDAAPLPASAPARQQARAAPPKSVVYYVVYRYTAQLEPELTAAATMTGRVGRKPAWRLHTMRSPPRNSAVSKQYYAKLTRSLFVCD